MQIDNTGFVKATLTNYLEYMTSDIQEQGTFGSDYTIKKEGVVDAILSTTSNAMISLEDKIAFALKQLNPYTAEGEWQDNLYSLIGLVRNYATNTVVTRTIEGEIGTTIGINELVFRTSENDEFYLNTEVVIGETGKVEGSFTAYQSGSIKCPIDSNLTLVSAPLGILGVYYTEGNITTIGDDYEDDSEFRLRWLATNSIKSSNTKGGMRKALLPLCDNKSENIKIRQNRNTTLDNPDLPKHTMNIVVKSAESNETIAETILDNLVDGVGLAGNTTVTLQDSENNDIDIKFTKATSVDIHFNIEIILTDGATIGTVANNIKKVIVDNFEYGLGQRVVANDFYQYINAIEGVDYVTTLEVGTDGITYSQTVTTDFDEYGSTILDNITVAEAE